jgi:hypothetical protein
MNERIKELAEQAGLEYNFDPMLWLKQEKFAELIVREVLGQVDEFSRLTKAYQKQGIDPEIDVTKEVLKNLGFPRFPRS